MIYGLDWALADERAAAAQKLDIELSRGIVLVGPSVAYTASDGRRVEGTDVDLCASITTDGHRIHHAFTGTAV